MLNVFKIQPVNFDDIQQNEDSFTQLNLKKLSILISYASC